MLRSNVGTAEPAAAVSTGYSRRYVLAGTLSMAILSIAGCDGFFISSTTTTTLTSSATMATSGTSIVLTAKVVSAAATGTVTFYDGTTELGTATVSSGSAAYTTSTLADGTHTLTAVYGGDTTFNSSTSAGGDRRGERGAGTDDYLARFFDDRRKCRHVCVADGHRVSHCGDGNGAVLRRFHTVGDRSRECGYGDLHDDHPCRGCPHLAGDLCGR